MLNGKFIITLFSMIALLFVVYGLDANRVEKYSKTTSFGSWNGAQKAVGTDPISYSGFQDCSSADYMANMFGTKPPSKPSSIQTRLDEYEQAQVQLPKDMTMSPEDSVVYDRLIFSNTKSRLRGDGDPLRGDLRIIPDSYKKGTDRWFQVSVNPSVDLQQGAFGLQSEIQTIVNSTQLPVYGF